MRMMPSTTLNMTGLAKIGFTRFSSVAAASGRNLYMKMKKPTEMAMFTAATHPLISTFLPLLSAGASCSKATSAEKRSARKPSVIA